MLTYVNKTMLPSERIREIQNDMNSRFEFSLSSDPFGYSKIEAIVRYLDEAKKTDVVFKNNLIEPTQSDQVSKAAKMMREAVEELNNNLRGAFEQGNKDLNTPKKESLVRTENTERLDLDIISIDFRNCVIRLFAPIKMQELYSTLKRVWKETPQCTAYMFPISHSNEKFAAYPSYKLINTWKLDGYLPINYGPIDNEKI